MDLKRRDVLLSTLFGAGHIGLRAAATGLPAWFLINPRATSAQTLDCLIQSQDKLQFLIVSASSSGDPLNCNVPGTYDGDAADVIHPMQPEMAPTPVTLGGNTFTAAAPWAADATGARYAWLDRTVFFHDLTGSTVHGDQPKVMKLLGATNQGEMMVSVYAKSLAACFGTVQPEPVAVGARGNSSELVSYAGRTLPSIAPTQLKQLLTGSKNDPLVRMRTMRDTSLDRLNAMVKASGNTAQRRFLDAMAASQGQVRMLADQLGNTLSAITADDVNGQALAAAALIAARVTPVVTMHIPFGGDNHTDTNLQSEADQHVSGVQGIDAVMKALAGLGLSDKVTFATMNVFGRNLNGIDKVTNRTGRDHFGSHSVTIMIGKNIAPGVIGGVVKRAKGTYMASDIDSATGAAKVGGDIPAAQTNLAAAKTLGVALGIPSAQLAPAFTASAGGKVVNAALSGVSG